MDKKKQYTPEWKRQSGPGKLLTGYDDRSGAQEVWGLQFHDSSLVAGVSKQSALALR